MTLQQALAQATSELAGISAPRRSAEVLLAHVVGRERAWLYGHSEEELGTAEEAAYAGLIARRMAGAPQQHLIGVQEFYGREFRVTPEVLIPRPETELVVEAVLELMPRDRRSRIVDVGTGSGCIAVTLGLERAGAEVVATDVSAAALVVARGNAQRLGAAVEFVEADLLSGVGGGVDVVVSNPPYLAEAELVTLAAEVRDHEPRMALVAGPLGTEIYARLIAEARGALRPGGWLVLELGYASAAAVRGMLGVGWGSVETRRDLQGWERVMLGRRIGVEWRNELD